MTRLVVAGLSGDSGKTIVSLGLLAALRRRGFSVCACKKGPDYIDAAWLSWASQTTCRNLDTYMVGRGRVLESFALRSAGSDIAVIEGNRGLFDGMDTGGTHSTAELAKLLQAPVILVVNTAKATRTVAALINGCVAFDPEVRIAGVILNRVAGSRHDRIMRQSIETYCKLPVLGTVPNLGGDGSLIPGRHLGLVTPSEFRTDPDLLERFRKIAEDNLDIDGLVEIARSAEPLPAPDRKPSGPGERKVKIGFFGDSVFTFYYPENLEALETEGAELVPVSSLEDSSLPDIDGLYIGGGFPETHAEKLARNASMMKSVRRAAEDGMPIYAECGGLIYLSRSLIQGESRYPMAGVFPVELKMHARPVGHGYTLLRVDRANPFFDVGSTIRGHEFHYSGPATELKVESSCMTVDRGYGLGGGRDGLLYRNTLAAYTHIHADGFKGWASSFVVLAGEYGKSRVSRDTERCDGDNLRHKSGRLERTGQEVHR